MSQPAAKFTIKDYELKNQFAKNYLANNPIEAFIDLGQIARTLPKDLPYSDWVEKVEEYLKKQNYE